MTVDECMTRLACDVASTSERVIAYEDVLNGKARPDDIKRLEATRAALGAANLYIDDQAKRSVPSIMAECRGIAREAMKMGGRLGLVVVDHLRKVADSGNYKNNPNKSEGEKAAMLKDMAKLLDCTVLTLVQLNRGVEGRDDKRPVLSDLRDSGEIEEEADAVCMVYREAYYKAREKIPTQTAAEADWRDELATVEHVAEVMIAKNRHGQTGRINIGCNMASNKFWTVEERY
jgi:replicative DNA helicase